MPTPAGGRPLGGDHRHGHLGPGPVPPVPDQQVAAWAIAVVVSWRCASSRTARAALPQRTATSAAWSAPTHGMPSLSADVAAGCAGLVD